MDVKWHGIPFQYMMFQSFVFVKCFNIIRTKYICFSSRPTCLYCLRYRYMISLAGIYSVLQVIGLLYQLCFQSAIYYFKIYFKTWIKNAYSTIMVLVYCAFFLQNWNQYCFFLVEFVEFFLRFMWNLTLLPAIIYNL